MEANEALYKAITEKYGTIVKFIEAFKTEVPGSRISATLISFWMRGITPRQPSIKIAARLLGYEGREAELFNIKEVGDANGRGTQTCKNR